MKIFCQQCGNELKEGIVICPKCGFENKVAKGYKERKILFLTIISMTLIVTVIVVFLYRYEKIKFPAVVNRTITKYLGGKEYNGKDLVIDSLHQRTEGAKNMEAEIIDSRDSKVYRIVKMPDGRWWMAQNLNYQEGLTQNERSDYANGKEFTSIENGIPAIGSYWCNDGSDTYNVFLESYRQQFGEYPGKKGSGNSIERTNTCTTYGALYTWETAILPNGKGIWDESKYNELAATHNICPIGWHLPTDIEWALMLNEIENDVDSTKNHDSIIYDWAGTYAGTLLRSVDICQRDCKSSSTKAIWNISETSYTPSEQFRDSSGNTDWSAYLDSPPIKSAYVGIDYYGFSVVPAGSRGDGSFSFLNKGKRAYFWSSTLDSTTNALFRMFYSSEHRVFRGFYNRMNGFSVRCIQDINK